MTATLEHLYEVMTRSLNAWGFAFSPDMSAADVPGWDSLHHMLMVLDINQRFGVDLSSENTANLPDIAALLDAINTGMEAPSKA